MAEHGRYLYAVCRGLDGEDLDGLMGLGDAIVEGVEEQGLVGLVTSVDLDEYGEEGLRRNLERLDWLETAARGHDAVVQAAAVLAPTAPMRLATIFRDDDGVRRRLADQHDAISRVLDRIEGHEEWSVKVLTLPESDTVGETAPATSGAEYLRRRKREQEAREGGTRAAENAAEEVHGALVRIAAASRRLAPQDPRLTGHTGTMVHNAAYLVAQSDSDAFASAVSDAMDARPDVVVDARGPWPPYSFAMLDDQ